MVLEKALESPLAFKEFQSAHPKWNQSWVFIGRTDVQAEIPILWHLVVRCDSFEKTLMPEKIEGRRTKVTKKDEMMEWHHQLNGHGCGWTLRDGDW